MEASAHHLQIGELAGELVAGGLDAENNGRSGSVVRTRIAVSGMKSATAVRKIAAARKQRMMRAEEIAKLLIAPKEKPKTDVCIAQTVALAL